MSKPKTHTRVNISVPADLMRLYRELNNDDAPVNLSRVCSEAIEAATLAMVRTRYYEMGQWYAVKAPGETGVPVPVAELICKLPTVFSDVALQAWADGRRQWEAARV